MRRLQHGPSYLQRTTAHRRVSSNRTRPAPRLQIRGRVPAAPRFDVIAKEIEMAKLPPLPPLPGRDGKRKVDPGDKPDMNPIIEAVNESIPPRLPKDPWDKVQCYFRCAGCKRDYPWAKHHWGSWDTGERRPILVNRKDGKGKARIFVPVRAAGRLCTVCTFRLPDWKMTKEPGVSVKREK